MHASRRPSGGIGSFVSSVVHGAPATPPAPSSPPTTAGTAGAGGTGAAPGTTTATPPPTPDKPKETFYQKAVHWVEEPPYLFARLIRAGLILVGIIVGLRWGIALALRLLAYTFQPVTSLVGGYWGEYWFLIVLFVVGLFGTKYASSSWKTLFGTNKSPIDGAETFMGNVRKNYKHNIAFTILIVMLVFYGLDPKAQTSILGDWVPERFWALGNLAVYSQIFLLTLLIFIESRKIEARPVIKWPIVVIAGIAVLVSAERFVHNSVDRCPRALHWVYVWSDWYTDVNNLEGETSVYDWQERLERSRKSGTANTIGYLPEDTAPYVLWYTQFPNHGMIWPDDTLKGEFLIPAGAPLAAHGVEEVIRNATIEIVATTDFKTVVVIDTLRLGNVGESGYNWRYASRGLWNRIDDAGHADWRKRGAFLGFRLVDRNPFVNVVIRDIVAYR